MKLVINIPDTLDGPLQDAWIAKNPKPAGSPLTDRQWFKQGFAASAVERLVAIYKQAKREAAEKAYQDALKAIQAEDPGVSAEP